MNAPLLSCVVPTHASERYLDEALTSIRAQTWRPLELIVADDDSGPESLRSTRAIAHRHHARVVRHRRSGPAATRNLGLAHARGAFVAFLDADDLWHPEKLARQMAILDADRSRAMSTTLIHRFDTVDERGRPVLDPGSRAVPGLLTTTLLARREVFDAVGPLAAERWFSDSADWFLRAADLGLVPHQLEEALVYHRVHPENLSRSDGDGAAREFLRTIKASLDRRRAAAGD